MQDVYVVSAKRTPVGGFLGSLSPLPAPALGALVIRAVVGGTGPSPIDSVYFGNVLSAGLGQAPARQAALGAGLLPETDCSTVNKVCASGLKAIVIGAQQIALGLEHLVVAGGMESMSNAPHYDHRRNAFKIGDRSLTDGLLRDGLTDAYDHQHMGNAAELCARAYKLSRSEQDAYALQSYERAARATRDGKFAAEIVPVPLDGKPGHALLTEDEDIRKLNPEKVPQLKPAFEEGGTITAANASNLSDGAAALLLASGEALQRYGLKPLARIVAAADAAQPPAQFTTAPSLAIPKALKRAGLSLADIDLVELNEAYAAVALANQKLLGLDPRRMNVYGGAIAIGHPLGASGARICCTLLSALRQEGGRYGLAAICNGGGGATALIVEHINP